MTGVYVEVDVLDGVMNYGQVLLVNKLHVGFDGLNATTC